MNTIVDMQNEIDFFYHCKKFIYNHDFVIFFQKIDDALLVNVNLGSNVILISQLGKYFVDYHH